MARCEGVIDEYACLNCKRPECLFENREMEYEGKDCRWGREVCGNIECFVDSNLPPEYHGYEWFCPNGERRTDE